MLRTSVMILLLLAPVTSAQDTDFFERTIRPILTTHCVSCHGSTSQKSRFRLDSREALLLGGEGGVAVQSGQPEKSRLIQAVRHVGDLKMPSRKLADPDIAALEKWVTLGLPWPAEVKLVSPDNIAAAAKKHWAFQPLQKIELPKESPRNPIDGFVTKKLSNAKLKMSPVADRRTLIRRASFDLLGLPPTPEEVAAFEADTSPTAYEKVIDRLLASPRYGERWARHWLDVARYADNKGYVFFEDKQYPWAFTYRDYVISALNRDLPYDRFVLEQLAADQLSPDDSRTLAAMGFLTLGGHFMNNTHDIIDDRIDVVTRGLLGLTVSCARCHDHKFDPVPTADYYSLYGVFRSSFEPTVPPLRDPAPDTEAFRKTAGELKEREEKLVSFVTGKHRDLVTHARANVGKYLLAAHAARNQPPADDFMLVAEKGDLNPTMITRWRVYLEESRKSRDPIWKPWHLFADLPESEFPGRAGEISAALPKDTTVHPLIRDRFLSSPMSMKDVAERYGTLFTELDAQWQKATPKATVEKLPDPAMDALRQVLYGPRSPADAPLALDWGFLSLFPDRATQEEYKKLLKEVEVWSVKGPARVPVLLDSPRPYDPRVFLRGQPNRLGEPVPRQFLTVVQPQRKPFSNGSGRLELAREIVSRENPLTARVFVNRVWMHHFGTALVPTPSDFGLRSEPPTHPELLDFLAADFMDHGWSIKHLHRRIMTSAVYQQASTDRPEAATVDPENRLLWKMNRRRLDFESQHDSTLAVAGSLDLTTGGPAIQLFRGSTRRAVYGYIDRLEFPSLLTTFDVPSPATSNAQRNATTVAPQALYLMNGPFARTAAQKLLADPAIRNQSSSEKRLDAVFLRLFNRKPSDAETNQTVKFLAGGPETERWLDLVHGLLMTNEFAFID